MGAVSKRQERQALVTVADGNRVQDPVGGKCKKVTGFGNRATDCVTVKHPRVVETADGSRAKAIARLVYQSFTEGKTL